MPNATLLRAMFIEWAHDKQLASPTGYGVDAQEFMAANDIDLALMLKIVRSCADRGWVNNLSSQGNAAVEVTLEGMEEVEQQRKRRSDPVGRAAACRSGLLMYFHRRELEGEHLPIKALFVFADESYYEGDQFTVTEIDRAAAYLADKGLIKGATVDQELGPVRASVTPDGLDCIEQHGGDVRAYLKTNSGVASMTTNIGTFNNSGNAAIASTGVTQHFTGADVAGIAEFARVLLAGIDGLGVEDADLKEQLRAALEEIQAEAKAGAEPGKLKAALGKVGGYVAKAGQAVLTAAFMAVAVHMGLPPSQ